jgi:hypothetical protein
MKSILHLNYFFVGTPILLGLLGFICDPLFFFAAIISIFTGFFQVIYAIALFIEKDFRDIYLTIYLIVTILFFILWINTSWDWIWAMPPILAIYLSAIFFIEAKKEKS